MYMYIYIYICIYLCLLVCRVYCVGPSEALHTSDDGILGKPRDMWSVGCTIFNMLYGRCPFWAEDRHA